jgi:hypothetical protein
MADLEAKTPQPASGSQSVQLGVGTLIIIALIVTMCSGGSKIEQVQQDTADLKRQLRVIETKLDAMMQNGGAITFRDVEIPAPDNAGAPQSEEQ